jgi:hypothetical protein
MIHSSSAGIPQKKFKEREQHGEDVGFIQTPIVKDEIYKGSFESIPNTHHHRYSKGSTH